MSKSKIKYNPANYISRVWKPHIDAYEKEVEHIYESIVKIVNVNYYRLSNGMDVKLYDINDLESGISMYIYWNAIIKYNPDIKYRDITVYETNLKNCLNDITWYFIYYYLVRMVYCTLAKHMLINEGITDV